MRRTSASIACALGEGQSHADYHHVLTLLDVTVRLDHQIPAKAYAPLAPVHAEHPTAIGVVAAVRDFAVSIGQAHLTAHDQGMTVNRG